MVTNQYGALFAFKAESLVYLVQINRERREQSLRCMAQNRLELSQAHETETVQFRRSECLLLSGWKKFLSQVRQQPSQELAACTSLDRRARAFDSLTFF